MAISATFNVGDLSPYIEDEIDFGDLRANPHKGGEELMYVESCKLELVRKLATQHGRYELAQRKYFHQPKLQDSPLSPLKLNAPRVR